MVGVVVIAHGRLAAALVDAATSIAGPLPGVRALALSPGEGPAAFRATLEEAVAALDQGKGVVVLVDLVGGTPANCSLSLLEQGRVEVVAGVNLPMLLRLAIAQERAADAKSLAAELVEHGSKNVVDLGGALRVARGKT
jgi:PTS system mannose-specific IIA component